MDIVTIIFLASTESRRIPSIAKKSRIGPTLIAGLNLKLNSEQFCANTSAVLPRQIISGEYADVALHY